MTIYGHPKLGGTGRFPEGRLNKDDEGELQFSVRAVGSTVRIDFGKPIAWMGMYADNARAFARALLAAADDSENGGRS